MTKLLILIALIGSVALPTSVSADPVRIVDTGPSGPVGTWNADWNTAWLAAEFSTPNARRITGVEGWIVPSGVERFGGPLRITLLSDGGNIPSTPLFSTLTNIPGVGPAGWYGQSGLSWAIQPGSFWLSFEPLSKDNFSGTTFAMSGTTRAPLANHAFASLESDCDFRERACWPWSPARASEGQAMDLGVRIFAEPVTPTPSQVRYY